MKQYCESIFETQRWKTREIQVGKVGVGGDNPIRIQSMTTSNTRDVEATIEQVMRLADYGCDIARVTVQGKKEAEACEAIKNGLIQKGYEIPLVADIHFYPPAAMHVVDFVDKVRINPGNYLDRRATFRIIDYNDNTYQDEIDRITEGFSPLVQKCKLLGRAMRIGTNHGSLSDRIMNRYGDTPSGMVESALEFARVCRSLDFHNFLFSMKASNPKVMIQAYRLLTSKMIELGWDYPLHLGVTEAGDGEDGRIKSAVGIGSLLLDGLGDTVRVSLTEDPWFEIDPCKRLVKLAENYQDQGIAPFEEKYREQKRTIKLRENLPLHRDGTVILPLKPDQKIDSKTPPDAVLVENTIVGKDTIPLTALKDLTHSPDFISALHIKDGDEEEWQKILSADIGMILLELTGSKMHEGRHFFEFLKTHQLEIPVILTFSYDLPYEDLVIQASAEAGSLLSDGLGDGICLKTDHPPEMIRSLSFSILQATRMRSSKTEFIACPGCGRTLFNLQDVTKRIREKTAHLPGVKIAIMGCIVNGPGEMADADFGYVGSRAGKIDLYVGKTCVERNIDFADADERLIELIKKHDRWIEPEFAFSPQRA